MNFDSTKRNIRPINKLRLAYFRLAFYLAIFFCYLNSDFSYWCQLEGMGDFRGFRYLFEPILSNCHFLLFSRWLWLLSLIFCALGLLFKYSSIVAALWGFFLIGVRQDFGIELFSEGLPVIVLLLFPLTASSDKLSLDSIIRKEQAKDLEVSEQLSIFLMRLSFSLCFFLAALAKIKNSGFEWFSGQNLLLWIGHNKFHQLVVYDFNFEILSWLAGKKVFLGLCSSFAFFIQFFSPLAFFRKLRSLVLLSLFLFQTCVFLLFGWTFYLYFPVYLVWFLEGD